ncbi:MAG: hypothetical protein EAX91_01975 [Candidatus Lokiarchaeota archaeon]|nr:hypothetical protein [Candidatus Lokiarchaeota archaeon]
MNEGEPISENQVKEKPRNEIKEEIKREMRDGQREKKGESRKTAGIIISGVGAVLYLGFGFLFLTLDFGYSYLRSFPLTLVVIGGISMTGVIVALSKVKIGGIITLISLPIAFVIGIAMEPYYYTYYSTYPLLYMLIYGTPFGYLHVIPGGIICLTASDVELSTH